MDSCILGGKTGEYEKLLARVFECIGYFKTSEYVRFVHSNIAINTMAYT